MKTKWKADPAHSEITFKIKHLMISNVTGSFKTFEINVDTKDEDFLTAKVSVSVDAASIDTRNDQRDGHLKGADFFETEKFPHLAFASTKVEKVDDDSFDLFGDLTIKNVTKPVKLSVEYSGIAKDPWGNEKAGFTVTGKINRKDWGLNWNAALETGGVLVGDELKISAEVQLVKETVEQPA